MRATRHGSEKMVLGDLSSGLTAAGCPEAGQGDPCVGGRGAVPGSPELSYNKDGLGAGSGRLYKRTHPPCLARTEGRQSSHHTSAALTSLTAGSALSEPGAA